MKMDLSNVLLRSLMLFFGTLILLVDASADANNTTATTLQSDATTLITDAGTTQTLGGADGTATSTGTDLPTDLTTSLATDAGITTEQSTKPKKSTTEQPGQTTEKDMTTSNTTAKPPRKSGFKVGTFFCVIILIGCLVGIAFCGYQFYRKRQNDNYHTL